MPLELPQRTTYALIALFLLGVFLFSLNPLRDYDTFYHVKTGQVIWETKAVPHSDIFSYTASGAPWVTHEWLSQLTLYAAYAAGGAAGLFIFVALLAALTYALIVRLSLASGAALPAALIALFPGAALIFEVWVPRPQVFSYLLAVTLLAALEWFRREGRLRALAVACGVVLLWANMHASVILGIVLMFFYATAEEAKARLPRFGEALPLAARRALWFGAFLALALSFLNPNGAEVHIYIWLIGPATEALNVLEWRSILSYLGTWQAKMFLAGLLAADVFIAWKLVLSGSRRHATLALAALGVSLLPFIAVRHVGLAPLVVLAPLALALSDTRAFTGFFARLGALGGATLLALLGTAVAAWGLTRVPELRPDERFLPVGAADYIREKRLPGPVFNYLHDGGYLIWALWPDEKVFIDGRSDVYLGEPLKDFLAIARLEPGWEKLVDEKYRINLFLLPQDPLLAGSVKPLVLALPRRGFAPVYADTTSFIFVREKPLPRQEM